MLKITILFVDLTKGKRILKAFGTSVNENKEKYFFY